MINKRCEGCLYCDKYDCDNCSFNLNTTKKALAEKFGVQRTSLSRELAKMKKDGLIDYDVKTITLLK